MEGASLQFQQDKDYNCIPANIGQFATLALAIWIYFRTSFLDLYHFHNLLTDVLIFLSA